MARLRLEAILIASGVFVLLLHSSNVFPSESNERNVFARFLRKPTPAKVTKEELGRGSWTLIHTMAANYPEKPTPTERVHAAAFFQSIGTLYPCKLCRDHFARYISVQSPDVSSRQRLLLWTCEAHNEVNQRNGKPLFPCTLKEMDKRWGDCGCH